MNNWHEFLTNQTLSKAQLGNTLCPLSDSGLLYVGGEDAEEFLQNQLSNDIRQIDANTAQLSSFSTAKGRMIAIFRVIRIEGGYLLVMPRSLVADVMQKLQKFVIRSQVVMADITDSFAMFAVATNTIPDDETFPAELHQVYQSDSMISIRVHGYEDTRRYLLMTNSADEAQSLWQSLADTLTMVEPDAWRLQEIRSAVPTLYPQTMEAFVLQMSNLQLLNGVSFKKGCYPGQEVVARMQYLGKLKRRMFLVQLQSPNCPRPGDTLRSRDSDSEDGAGKVVDAMAIDSQHCLMLVIAQIARAETEQLVVSAQPDSALQYIDLPYSFEDGKN